jgi:branched-chain amino acid aminotransferase group I
MSKYNLPNPKNENTFVHVGGQLVKREDAKVSVLDSVVQGGDAVWEGLRVYDGKIFQLEEHLDRMFDSAQAMHFKSVPTRDEVKKAIFDTLEANGMRDETHIRLTLSRGLKGTSGMNPDLNTFGTCLIVLAEWKGMVYGNEGTRLMTATTRRNPPQCLDSKIHHNNLINNILAKIEANLTGADDAIMLDIYGYVSETNATNIFMVKKGVIYTPHADSCLPGLTRAKVIDVARENNMEIEIRRISPAEMHFADEVFTTGTMGGLSPVVEIDGRTIGTGKPGPVTVKLQEFYQAKTAHEGVLLPF